MQNIDQTIFFLLDGFRPDVLRDLVEKKRLPNIQEIFFDNGTAWTGSTVFPSTTGPAYLPYVTGCFPGTCNVPGIRWVDRKYFTDGNWNKKGTRSYVGYESFYFNQDIASGIPTIFEMLPDHLSVHNIVNRGVNKKFEPYKLTSSLLILFAKLSHQWGVVDGFAEMLAKKFLKSKTPKFSFITFLGVDEDAHLSTPFSNSTLAAYERVDRAIGKIIDVLKQKKIYDRTLIFGAADHGLSQTQNHFELCDFVENLGYKTFVYPKVYRRSNTAACMVSGNAMAHVYLKDGEKWEERMSHEKIVQQGILNRFLEKEAIDVLITKSASGAVHVTSSRGTAEISKTNGQLRYSAKSGDPFGLPVEMDGKNDYFDSTIDSTYPDAIMQSWQIMQSSRAGDIIVTSKINHDLRDRFEIPEHFSSHGSLHREHMLIPILCNQKIDSDIPKRSINVFPTMMKMMGNEVKSPIDGVSFI